MTNQNKNLLEKALEKFKEVSQEDKETILFYLDIEVIPFQENLKFIQDFLTLNPEYLVSLGNKKITEFSLEDINKLKIWNFSRFGFPQDEVETFLAKQDNDFFSGMMRDYSFKFWWIITNGQVTRNYSC